MNGNGGGGERAPAQEIAIIGMAGRFPGARSVDEFWANVRDGVESIRQLSEEELLANGVTRTELEDPSYVRACPVLDGIDKFDARFFGFSPREASVMDPAHRLFLELAWQAFEHAGYTALPEEGAVGVFATCGAPLYMQENVRTHPELMRSMGEFLVRHTGNDMNFLATRVSYEMDLRGPSMNVQTACSSALVALHLACQSLSRGDCGLALVGGATVLVPHGRGYVYKEGEIMSPDGHCRPFDEKSAGTVFGSGVGCVVLKRLQDALDDGDTIHAVVKGSAVNNDGAVKVGYLAPGVDGQASVIKAALESARVPADSIHYIETHGTGTSVGDPIEVEALNQAFRAETRRRHFCAIGSVKSNLGHLGEAAGIPSLIKAVMALKERMLPPSLGYERPNPRIDFEDSPFFVNDRLRPWESDGPRRCGITALGAGGTNCHVILEEPPEPLAGEGARARQLLVLSAKTRSALDHASTNLADALEVDGSLDLADAAYTLALGRRPLSHRRVLAAATREEAIRLLRERDPQAVPTGKAEAPSPSLVFMFPGGGAQYAGMGAELYELAPVYREAVDDCLAIANPALGRDLRSLMFAPPSERPSATRTLEQPSLTLPALFTTSYALAKLFESWGVAPVACIGHSMGEYVAACLGGVFTLEDALRLVMLRGRVFEKVEPGGMLSVSLSEADTRAQMVPGLDIAAINAPELCVVSGPVAAIEAMQRMLEEREVRCTRIRIDVAAHSAMLEPILDEFRTLCRSIPFRAPSLPFVSNLTGRWIRDAEATDPEYWVRHLRSTVRFSECLETALDGGERALLEVGPGRTLSSLARAQRTPVKHAFSSMRHPQEEASDLGYALTTLGRLWLVGVEVDWTALYEGQLRNRIPLPTYPFESESFWIAPNTQAVSAQRDSGAPSKRERLDEWFYDLAWKQQPRLVGDAPETRRWLVFSDGSRFAARLMARLEGEVIVALPGTAVTEVEPRSWTLDPNSSNQYADLIHALQERGQLPDHAVYLWSADRPLLPGRAHAVPLDEALQDSFFGPLYLARALGAVAEPMRLTVVTSGLARVADELLLPLRATALGAVYVAPREYPQLACRCIDLPAWRRPGARGRVLLDQLVEELRSAPDVRLVALRPGQRWVQSLDALKLPPAPPDARWLRDGGVYLITGGLGGIGLEIALSMARQKRVKLALLARAKLPAESEWDAILARPGVSSRGALRIRKVRELRALGAEVLVVSADVTDAESLRLGLERVRERFGPLSGVIHAAGLLDDEPMQSKTIPSMRRVLAPKVHGTLHLDALVREPLDFFVMFSSIASFLGLPGQVDYTAANAFLDAFARERSLRAPGRSVVINWNAWREVGMAAESSQALPSPSSTCAHPALDGYSEEGGERIFCTDFSVARHWLLAEHQIKGSLALLPGTGFVELARAAFAEIHGEGPVEIADLTFTSPFQVAKDEVRRLSIQLTPAGDAHEVAMRSGKNPRSAPHAIGDVRPYRGPSLPRLDLLAISSRCSREERPKDGFLDQDFVAFGARWANIRQVRYGRGEALLELCLDERFVGDLQHYRLHPALLDMATGGAQALIPGVDLRKDFYVPLGYGRVISLAPMPQHVFSHVRCLADTRDGLAYFDVTLTGPDGVPFASISRFTMKRLEGRTAMTAASETHKEPAHDEAMAAILREAIRPEEGVEAFARIMAQPATVQVVASSVDVERWDRQLREQTEAAVSGEARGGSEGFSRPSLSSDYVAPSSKMELALAEIWADLVGVRQVGVLDDFFELGGNSLVAVRLFADIKRRFKVSLPLSSLFEAPTIRKLAQLIEGRLAPQPELPSEGGVSAIPQAAQGYSSLVAIQPNGARPGFFCAAGMGGNPLNLAALALLVGLDQPFYGLQPQGLDGQSQPHSTVTEMAAYYLDLIRQKQPHGPYYLGGYSGGGITAFEMACQLEAMGEEVGALVFLDSFAPIIPTRAPAERAKVHLERLREQGPRYIARTLHSRMRSELAEVQRIARRPLRKLFPYRYRLETVADQWLESAAIYQPGVYRGDAMLFRAALPSGLTAGTARIIDERQGWGAFVLGGVEVSVCPGDHNSICEQPNVRVLARRLRAYLDRRMRRHGPELRAAE